MKRILSLIFCLVLLGSIQIALENRTVQINTAMGAETGNFSSEMSHGFINGAYNESLWYVWLNTSGTHLLFLTMYSANYPSSINYFVGQHYFTTSGTEVFIGNRLLGFEIYEDVNKNSVLDADFTNRFNNVSDETRYFFMLNASKTVDLTPPTKSLVNNITHYMWGVKHTQAQGNIAKIGNTTGSYVGDPETGEWIPSYFDYGWIANLNSLGFIFDYWVNNSAAYLKIGLEFGTFTVEYWMPEEIVPVNFNNNSLSAVYTTSVLSPKQYQISLSNPREATGEGKIVNSTSIDIEKEEAFKTVFDQNYTLSGSPTTHQSTAGVYPISSLPGDIISQAKYFTQNTEDIFKEQLAQTSPGLSSNLTLGIRKSSLIYRVCYPIWENRTLSHDPLYIAYIGEANFINPKGLSLPQTWLIATLIFGTAVLLAAVYHHKRIRSYKVNSLIKPS